MPLASLDELTKQLNDDGFNIHSGGVYLRLIPRRSSSLEGKRHVTTVPIKLIRDQDQKLCVSTIKHLEEISSTLVPNEVCFISQYDKARVPIGLTAANKQSPLLMHVEYRVSLPDHDWVVAAQHKLIPFVYGGIVVQPNGLGKPEAVSYSGRTYIAILSGKHSSSTAYAHALGFERLLQLHQRDSLKAPEKNVHEENHHFPSLCVSKSLNLDEILPRSTMTFKVDPYNLYCQSVHSQLLDWSLVLVHYCPIALKRVSKRPTPRNFELKL